MRCFVLFSSLFSILLTASPGLAQSLTSRVQALEAKVDKLTRYIQIIESTNKINGLKGPHVMITGANVHVRSGSGQSQEGRWPANSNWHDDWIDTPRGLGNLIIGYNEANTGDATKRGGSHNLVIGRAHRYTSSGGLVAGSNNTISALGATVTAGGDNTASGIYSSVSGGSNSTASGHAASVSGGGYSTASRNYASVSGGIHNRASRNYASVSGGYGNTASGLASSVSGGNRNIASGVASSVSGGNRNTASGGSPTIERVWKVSGGGASISGGTGNTASGPYASVSGGQGNTATSTASSVSGGSNNQATGNFSTIGGGSGVTVAAANDFSNRLPACLTTKTVATQAKADVVFEGCNVHFRNGASSTNTTNGLGNLIVGYNEDVDTTAGIATQRTLGRNDRTGSHNVVIGPEHEYSSHSGLVVGVGNIISGEYASVSGGRDNEASGDYGSVSGGQNNEASDDASSVSGGLANVASGSYASVLGGQSNTAGPDPLASVSVQNRASGAASSVSGGLNNRASGRRSSISGGKNQTANADL